MRTDKSGRPWAKISEVKVGDLLEPDGGFDCLECGAHLMVFHDSDGLFIKCSEGHHYLDGQIEGDHYIGLYKVER